MKFWTFVWIYYTWNKLNMENVIFFHMLSRFKVTFLQLNIQLKIFNIFKVREMCIINQKTSWTPFAKPNQIKPWQKVSKSLLIQKIKILISVARPFRKCGLQYFSLTFAKFDPSTNKRPWKSNSLKSIVEIKFGQKLWSQFFKILAFWYQSRDHFKYMDCRSYSLIFTKFDLSTKKLP